MSCGGLPNSRENLSRAASGEVYAYSEMIDHMALLREFYVSFSRISPSLVAMQDCDSLLTHPKNLKMITEKYLVCHFLSIQLLIEEGELDNAYWLSATENPADGLTKIKSEMGPISSPLESGRFQPGLLRALKGLAFRE